MFAGYKNGWTQLVSNSWPLLGNSFFIKLFHSSSVAPAPIRKAALHITEIYKSNSPIDHFPSVVLTYKLGMMELQGRTHLPMLRCALARLTASSSRVWCACANQAGWPGPLRHDSLRGLLSTVSKPNSSYSRVTSSTASGKLLETDNAWRSGVPAGLLEMKRRLAWICQFNLPIHYSSESIVR